MCRVRADVFSEYLIESKPQSIKPRSENLVRGARLLVSLGPGIDESSNCFVARRITDRNFQRIRRRTAFDAKHADAIRSIISQFNGSEICNAIRRYVLVRIAHLVDELLLDRGNIYAAT